MTEQGRKKKTEKSIYQTNQISFFADEYAVDIVFHNPVVVDLSFRCHEHPLAMVDHLVDCGGHHHLYPDYHFVCRHESSTCRYDKPYPKSYRYRGYLVQFFCPDLHTGIQYIDRLGDRVHRPGGHPRMDVVSPILVQLFVSYCVDKNQTLLETGPMS